MSAVRIATRGSPLALTQAGLVARQIEVALGVATEMVKIKTSGDRIQDVALAALGGKGLFVKEIETALLEGRADLAIHSAKDLPGELAPGLVLAAFPERADPRDALIGRLAGTTLEGLPRGARVGTGSLRRRSQLLALRPDLEVVPLRGNVDTRLRKLEDEKLDSVILACAGLDRLGLGGRIHQRVPTALLLPAVGQGTLALEVREGSPLGGDLAALDHAETRAAIGAERAFLARLAGDCNVPLGAFAEVRDDGTLTLRGFVASEDGARVARAVEAGRVSEAEALGARTAEALLRAGGREILRELGLEARG